MTSTIALPKELRAKFPYTSEREIRQKVVTACTRQKTLVTKHFAESAGLTREALLEIVGSEKRLDVVEKWIGRLVADAKRRKVLMTEQQLADWRTGTEFKRGVNARYVGPTRDELLLTQNAIVPRHHGQLGFISSVTKQDNGLKLYVFHPTTPQRDVGNTDDFFVDLEFLERTPGFLLVERVV